MLIWYILINTYRFSKGINPMNHTKRILTILLAGLLAAGLVSCSSGGTNEETASADTAGQISANAAEEPVKIPEEPKGNGRSEVKDSLPETMDFGGTEVRVFSRGGDKDTLMEFSAEEMTGDVVTDAVFEKDRKVEEYLGIDLDIVLEDEDDLYKHIDYIHYNSMKHYDIAPKDWKYSSFKKFVHNGFYEIDWCNFEDKYKIKELNIE